MSQRGFYLAQEITAAARRRHPALAVAAIGVSDAFLDNEINSIIDEVLNDVTKAAPRYLVMRFAPIVIVGANGGAVDLDPPEGEIMSIYAMDCTKQDGTSCGVVLADVGQRNQLAGLYAGDRRPAGYVDHHVTYPPLWIGGNFKIIWRLNMVANWLGVTGVTPYAVPKFQPFTFTGQDEIPGPPSAPAFAIPLPRSLFGPMAERLAMLLGHRANLDKEWQDRQAIRYKEALALAASRGNAFGLDVERLGMAAA